MASRPNGFLALIRTKDASGSRLECRLRLEVAEMDGRGSV